MEDKKSKGLGGLIGILGVGAIISSLILLSSENMGYLLKTTVTAFFQLDLGLLLVVFGIKENKTKGKPKGNPYLYVGIAALASTVYTIVIFYSNMAQ